MQDTARKALVASLIVVAVVASALALWKLRIVLALLFLALIIAASMRPSVEALARRHIPRGIGILAHYAALAGLIAILLWAIVPRAIDQSGCPLLGRRCKPRCALEPGGRGSVARTAAGLSGGSHERGRDGLIGLGGRCSELPGAPLNVRRPQTPAVTPELVSSPEHFGECSVSSIPRLPGRSMVDRGS